MKTGASQLSKISDILSDNKKELELYRRLGWKVGNAKEIVTCIVSCNGMFPGLYVEGHPVRRLRELINMVETGYVRFVQASVTQDEKGLDVTTNDVAEYHLWRSAVLRPEFLHEYIARDLLRGPMFDAMVELDRSFDLDGWQLEFQSYALDLNRVLEALNKQVSGESRGGSLSELQKDLHGFDT